MARRQGSNEIDEFVTDVLRKPPVGMVLDLAALNIARGRPNSEWILRYGPGDCARRKRHAV